MSKQAINQKVIFDRPRSMKDAPFHYCPGCHHGIVHRLVGEAIDHFGVQESTIAVASVGCSVFLYNYFEVDVVEAPHGRAPAVATGIKRSLNDKVVFTYQGDGDLASIGLAEILHAANRGELITVIFVNNTIYGMTGGQMAPTTLPGQWSTTSPEGRSVEQQGHPFRMAEIIGSLQGSYYSARVAVHTPKHVISARKAIRRAFESQVKREGFGFVEVLCTCPTNWKMDPITSLKRVEKDLIPYFPLGTFKDCKTDTK
jgi:2-oxoglutarate ferredoxin oxidoreductase subunit beta